MAVLNPSLGGLAFLPKSLQTQLTKSIQLTSNKPNFAAAVFKKDAGSGGGAPAPSPVATRDQSWQMVNPNEYPPPAPTPIYKQPIAIAAGVAALLAVVFVATR